MSAPAIASAPELLEEAASRAGGAELEDLSFVPTLELLLASCRRTAALNATGEVVLRQTVLRHLRNRLYLQAHVRDHPDVPSRPLRCAVVVTGLPRTGTTLLHGLLAVDPRSRVLRLWEALHPVPPHEEGRHSRAALVAQAESWLARFHQLAPTFRAIHALTAEGPEECDALLQNAFASQHFDDMFDARDYSAWLQQADLRQEYAYYALQLRALSEGLGAGQKWVLKSPSHLGHLDALLEACPGALVVHCHRHPAQCVPSYASLILAVRQPSSDAVSPEVVGRQALERCALAARRALEVRASSPPERFFDVAYADLVRDPLATVRALYERMGRPLATELESEMRRWLADHPQHGHGVHRYTPAQFGLAPEAVGEALAGYVEKFAWALGA